MLTRTHLEKTMHLGDDFRDIRYGTSRRQTIIPLSMDTNGITRFLLSGTTDAFYVNTCVWLELHNHWTLKEWYDAINALQDKRRIYWFGVFVANRVMKVPRMSQDIDPVTGERLDVICPWRKLASEFGYTQTYPHKVGRFDQNPFPEKTLAESVEDSVKMRRILIPFDRTKDAHNGRWKPEKQLVENGEGI